MQTAELMETVLKAGEIMLTSGAEIYRVEETIIRICSGYGYECESFVLPTGIFVSIRDKDGSMQTTFKRIRRRTVDLSRIDRVNTFSRSLGESRLSFGEAQKQLAEIESGRKYSLPVRLAAAIVGSFVFTMLFQGSWFDGITAGVIGFLVYIMKEGLGKKGFFQFFELFLAGLAAGFLSVAAVRLFPGLNEYKIIIGSVMLYLPGMAMTNSIKDAFYDDLVASLARMGEAFLVAAAVAAGVVISLAISMNWG